MSQMLVAGIALDPQSQHHVLVLNDLDKRRALPIWIGASEASAISLALDCVDVPRPMSHDLIVDIIGAANYRVSRIDIHENVDNIFLCSMTLSSAVEGADEIVLDARPSDAVAVALRAGAPIFVSPQVFASGTVSLDKELDEKEKEDFRRFLARVNASDFQLPEFGSGAA